MVDATGVGAPVVDLLRQSGLEPIPVVITGGDKESRSKGTWRVPKQILVSTMQVVLQTGRLQIASSLSDAQTLVQEMLDFRVKINVNAHAVFEPWRDGSHDDLVLSLAIALWEAERWHSNRGKFQYWFA